ncbi:hypothetical protein [Streptomyces sp. NPDC058683]|uniref:hypothetical protein n=1 Tax=Streptomyces sp. NPDC058683 TaxID=3346597 RepID=UPI003654CF58
MATLRERKTYREQVLRQAVAIVAHGGQQDGGAMGPDPHGVNEPGVVTSDQLRQAVLQHSGLHSELLYTLSQRT